MPRLAPIDLNQLTPEQREVADAIMAGPRGGLRGPFEPWLRSPVLADRAQKLGEFCRFNSSLPPRLSELAILVTAKHWRAQFEWWAHARMAAAAGVEATVIEAIRVGEPPALAAEDAQAVYGFVAEYLATNRVSDATYGRALAAVSERGVVDLVGIVGYYGLVAMTLNVFEVGLPEGEAEPLA